MKTKITTVLALLAMATFTFTSCKKDDPKDEVKPAAPKPPTNEQEVITTLKLTLTSGTNIATYTFEDEDGDGGKPGKFGGTNQSDSVITIDAKATYTVAIELLDKTKTPVDKISEEVLEEGVDHLFFFNQLAPATDPNAYSVYLTGSMVTIKYLDKDKNNRGIGLLTEWKAPTMAMTKSPLQVALRHQPGVKNGTYAPGETDIQVMFKLIVKDMGK